MSRRTGIATSTISDWRKKKINPQADKLVSICKVLDMSLVDLLCDEDNAEQEVSTDYLLDEKKLLGIYRKVDSEVKKHIIRYVELLELCKQFNENNDRNQRSNNGLCSCRQRHCLFVVPYKTQSRKSYLCKLQARNSRTGFNVSFQKRI